MISNDIKLLAVYDKLEKQIKALQLKHGVDGKDGISIKGDQGDRGHDGVGHDGKQGDHGADGSDGSDGNDGVSITEASIDFDNHLVIKLSDGSEIDAGEIKGGSGGDQYFRSGSTVQVQESASSLKGPEFTYTLGVLTRIDYDGGEFKTLTYVDGVLSTIELNINGAVTTKTLNYTTGVLTSITET